MALRFFWRVGLARGLTLDLSKRGAATQPPEERLELGFFRRLFTPQEEEDLVDGMRNLVLGRNRKALEQLDRLHRPDRENMVVVLAMCELLVEERGGKPALQRAVRLTRDVDNHG